MVRLSIIILSYNTKEFTLKCVTSVIVQYKQQLETKDFEIIVVDNASTDASASVISNQNAIRLIRNKENYGFSKGNNIGAKHARGKYLFFLNSDTEVLDEGLEQMIAFLDQNESIGILGARLQNVDGSAQASAGSFYNLSTVLLMLLAGERIGFSRSSPNQVARVDWVSGGAMMVRSELFKTLGGFDEHFFMYVEDMEFCFRAWKLGLSTYFFPKISIEHATLGSSNRAFAILAIYKGILYFYQKHKSPWGMVVVRRALWLKAFTALAIGMLTGNSYLRQTYAKALKLV